MSVSQSSAALQASTICAAWNRKVAPMIVTIQRRLARKCASLMRSRINARKDGSQKCGRNDQKARLHIPALSARALPAP
jgi:hypothetical protein